MAVGSVDLHVDGCRLAFQDARCELPEHSLLVSREEPRHPNGRLCRELVPGISSDPLVGGVDVHDLCQVGVDEEDDLAHVVGELAESCLALADAFLRRFACEAHGAVFRHVFERHDRGAAGLRRQRLEGPVPVGGPIVGRHAA